MKEKYTSPEIEIIAFENEDVITESDTELLPQ
jgi:hypothetical protein